MSRTLEGSGRAAPRISLKTTTTTSNFRSSFDASRSFSTRENPPQSSAAPLNFKDFYVIAHIHPYVFTSQTRELNLRAAFESSRFRLSMDESTPRLHLGSDDPCVGITPSESVSKIPDSCSASALLDLFVTFLKAVFLQQQYWLHQHVATSLDSFSTTLAATVSKRSNRNRRGSCELSCTAPCDVNSPCL